MADKESGLTTVQAFLTGAATVSLGALIVFSMVPSQSSAAAQAAPVVAEALPCVPIATPATCEGLMSKDACADSCKQLMEKQELLHRGLPAFISDKDGDYHAGEYVVSWVDCRRMFFVGHPTTNAEFPVLFNWPKDSCACEPRAMRLNMQENYICTTVQ